MSSFTSIGIRISALHLLGIIFGFVSLFIEWNSILLFPGGGHSIFFEILNMRLFASPGPMFDLTYSIGLILIVCGFYFSLISPVGGIIQLIGVVTYIFLMTSLGGMNPYIIGIGPFVCLFSSLLVTVSLFYPFKYVAAVILPIGNRVGTIPSRFRERLFIFYRKNYDKA